MFTPSRLMTLAVMAASLTPLALAQPAPEPAAGLNLISNGSFEHDWYNSRPEIMGCPLEPRVMFGQADSYPDGWAITQPGAPARPVLRSADARTGRFGVTLTQGQSLTQEGIGYALLTREPFKAPALRLSAMVKGGPVQLTVTLRGLDTAESAKETDAAKRAAAGVAFTKTMDAPAAADWQRVSFDVPVAEIEAAVKDRLPGAIEAVVAITASGGQASVDDVRLERPLAAPAYTLVPNAGFEEASDKNVPAQWSGAQKSLRHTGKTWYYIWRTWYHYMGVPRGRSEVDQLVTLSGKNAFRMNVPPGDEKYIESAAIALNQSAPERMAIRFDYNAYMLADLVVRVMDEEGHEIFFDHFAPGTTGGWHTYQRAFTPAPVEAKATAGGAGVAQATGTPKPVKSVRVRIGVRGVNGSAHDDINEWINVNHAGVLWFDNVGLVSLDKTKQELEASGAKTFALDQRANPVIVEAIDLGERLSGPNTATLTMLTTTDAGFNQEQAKLTVRGPYREEDPQKAGYANGTPDQADLMPDPKVTEQTATADMAVPPKSRVTVALPYRIDTLARDWREEYRVELSLGQRPATHLSFGTWSQPALVEVLRAYSFPDEAEQLVSMNLGLARPALDATKSLKLELRRAADDQVVVAQDVADFEQAKAKFNLLPLPNPPSANAGEPQPDPKNYGWQGDATNFLQAKVDLSKLPVHPQDRPERDHYITVVGIGQDGKETFRGESPRFGRMQPNAEKLDPITKVEVTKDNELFINGKGFLPRGHIQMQQNFGPSPMSHHPVDFKSLGFNTAGHGQSASQGDVEVSAGQKITKREFIWRQNMYYVSHRLPGHPPMTPAVEAEIKDVLSHPAVIGVNYIEWEGAPEAGTTAEGRTAYAKAIKKLIGTRPLWISAGWYSPTVNGPVYPDYLEHDFFSPESHSYLQPSQLDKEVLAKKKLRGEPAILSTFPNVFNEMPYAVERFEHWTDIIRGHRGGYMIIGLPGDPTLFRGMNGEMKFIESFLFSKEKAPEVKVAPAVEHLVKSAKGKTYIMASNAGPVIGGDWKWNTQLKDGGVASHTGDALWSRFHPFMRDYHSHYYKDDRPVEVKAGDKIVQYVYVPTDKVRFTGPDGTVHEFDNKPVENLTLMVRGNGDWAYQAVWGDFNHQQFTDSHVRLWLARDMHPMFWGTVGFVGPDAMPNAEGMAKLHQHVFTAEQFKKVGGLPEKGKWVRLEVPVEKLGLQPGSVIDGFGFMSKGGHAWWGRTELQTADQQARLYFADRQGNMRDDKVISRPGENIVLCDGAVGIHPAKLAKVRFEVPGLKAGAKVKVCFEQREITAGDGFFEDDLTGEPGYQNLWVGLYGDKIGETGYYGDGTFYNYNFGRIAARLYEIGD